MRAETVGMGLHGGNVGGALKMSDGDDDARDVLSGEGC